MFSQRVKTDWVLIFIVALIAGGVSGGLVAYIDDTVRQTSLLSRVAEFKKPEKKDAAINPADNISQGNPVQGNNNGQNNVPGSDGVVVEQPEETTLNAAIPADLSCYAKDANTGWDICINKQYNFEFEKPHEFDWVKNLAVISDCSYQSFQEKCPKFVDLILAFQKENGCTGPCLETTKANLSSWGDWSGLVVNGMSYCAFKGCDGAAGSRGCEFYHAAVKGKNCFVVYSKYFRPNCANYGDPNPAGSDHEIYVDCVANQTKDDATFDKVISTFKLSN